MPPQIPKPWYLYILECAGGRLYTGITVNVENRFKAHTSGKGAKFTRSYPPERLVLVQDFADRAAASRAEYAIKKLSPAAKRNLIRAAATSGNEDRLMTGNKTPDARIDELEIRLVHQDKVIDDLNEVIARQWKAIDELSRKLAALSGRMQAVEENSDAPPPVEPPPPHY
ncbi:SlyX family protein [Parvibaculum sp.]|uniref:SlyX family protein n=1 Tax=Parvibaculum sp. TaxID=2024848 RepID=UPI003521AF36